MFKRIFQTVQSPAPQDRRNRRDEYRRLQAQLEAHIAARRHS